MLNANFEPIECYNIRVYCFRNILNEKSPLGRNKCVCHIIIFLKAYYNIINSTIKIVLGLVL